MSTTHIYHQEGGRKLSVIWNQRYTHMPASAKLHSCYLIINTIHLLNPIYKLVTFSV